MDLVKHEPSVGRNHFQGITDAKMDWKNKNRFNSMSPCPITEYWKCCVMIQNTSFRHSDVHPFGLTLPDETREIKLPLNIRHDPFFLFLVIRRQGNNLWGVLGGGVIVHPL